VIVRNPLNSLSSELEQGPDRYGRARSLPAGGHERDSSQPCRKRFAGEQKHLLELSGIWSSSARCALRRT